MTEREYKEGDVFYWATFLSSWNGASPEELAIAKVTIGKITKKTVVVDIDIDNAELICTPFGSLAWKRQQQQLRRKLEFYLPYFGKTRAEALRLLQNRLCTEIKCISEEKDLLTSRRVKAELMEIEETEKTKRDE